MNQLWVEKYRPHVIQDYVFRDEDQRRQVMAWIESGSIPHLLFSGSPGVGKTTLARILINQLDVDPFDVLDINASRESKVDDVRNKISKFVETMPYGDFKVVLLDEADYISPNGQAALRGVMETYSSTARFILTCNYAHKIIPAIHSRCQGFQIQRLDQTEFTARVATVLVTENIEFELDVLDNYVRATYPDLRKCLNTCQMNSATGTLALPHGDEIGDAEWRVGVVNLFKSGRVTEARKLLCKNARAGDMEEIFRWMYDNLDLWSTDVEKQDQAIIIIRDGLVNHNFVADAEINLSATLIELANL